MTKNREPHEKRTTQSNGLTKAQEVLYQKEFKKADGKTTDKKLGDFNKNNQ